jgi:uncharacterized membrane protein YoaK (UPF0700 family)
MIIATKSERSSMIFACITACTAGMTNIAGMMACFNFTANLTGHATNIAQHLIAGNYYEMFLVLGWLLMFLVGAALAHFLIRSYESINLHFAQALPLLIELCLLLGVGIYGSLFHGYSENEAVLLTFVLLLAMGIQNSAVNTISEGKIKTSHLTGLFTDLGSELSEWIHPKTGQPRALAIKIRLRLLILVFYVLGAVAAGWLFTRFGFFTFYVIAVVLSLLVTQIFREMIAKIKTRQI